MCVCVCVCVCVYIYIYIYIFVRENFDYAEHYIIIFGEKIASPEM